MEHRKKKALVTRGIIKWLEKCTRPRYKLWKSTPSWRGGSIFKGGNVPWKLGNKEADKYKFSLFT